MSNELDGIVLPGSISYGARTCLGIYLSYPWDRSFEFDSFGYEYPCDTILDDRSRVLEIVGNDRESTGHGLQIH